eukprot:CAMPEP_0197021808 /NCGR_PEP_ID=MMETSP1384-20130603/2718_1 /TAXON_ID=29189 /ORGANISM="Ammonia sp." /LENGTH=329 /DNA_ID=CAMNT_0042449719 /DNA_START=91 /DNA_END=1080 /DNA_ORIENTATION=+
MSLKLNSKDDATRQAMHKISLSGVSKISESLQGSVWKATRTGSSGVGKPVVVKVTDRYLHQNALGKVNKTAITVHENIVSEAKILRLLSKDKTCPPSIVRFRSFYETETEYFLMEEHGGSSLFEFVNKAHRFIRAGKIELSHWHKIVKVIFKQMIECIAYLHSKRVCHLDISLENFLINDVLVAVIEKRNQEILQFLTDRIQIKLCDFGLSELFGDDECLCVKWCGKQGYKSPEVLAEKRAFAAKKNDIWCLGVCLFMMSVGYPPWKAASPYDEAFVFMTNGNMKQMLNLWRLSHYVDDELLDLFRLIFQREDKRVGLAGIEQHAWFKK